VAPDGELADGDTLRVAGAELAVLHTPGHSPGGICLHDPHAARVFAGDTLFRGGPGATGRSYSDFPTILQSISERGEALLRGSRRSDAAKMPWMFSLACRRLCRTSCDPSTNASLNVR